jgi:hypothetical protein
MHVDAKDAAVGVGGGERVRVRVRVRARVRVRLRLRLRVWVRLIEVHSAISGAMHGTMHGEAIRKVSVVSHLWHSGEWCE